MTRILTLLVVTAVCLTTANADAQNKKRRARTVGIATLVGHPAVHKELKTTEAQKKTLQDAAAAARKGYAEIQSLKSEERQKKSRPITQKLRSAMNATLDAKQKKRLLQIELQYSSGSWILQRAEVAEALELTREQRKAIRQLSRDAGAATRKLRDSIDDSNRRDVQRQIAEKQAAARKAALEQLTEEQKKKWKAVRGEPFELPRGKRKKKRSS